MLKKVPKILSPSLVKVLMEMGHGDEIVIGDGNFPGASHANKLINAEGLNIPELLDAILEVFPLDHYVKHPVSLMQIEPGDEDNKPSIWNDYEKIIANHEQESVELNYIDRHEFYEQSKKAYAIVTTTEKALYANIILKKGVVK